MPCWAKNSDQDNKTRRIRNITDGPCLFAFSLFWCFILVIAVFSFTFGDPKRLAHGYDSFGNICGSDNYNQGGLELSGQDMTNKPYLFYFDKYDIKNSMHICVSSCPDTRIRNLFELRNYYQTTELNLCRYDFDVLSSNVEDIKHGLNESLTISSSFGPCPVFPIEKTATILNRCLPTNYKGTIHDLLSREDIAQLLLLDIYNSWLVIIGFFFCALVGAFAMMSLFYLSSIFASHFILVCVILVSIGSVSLLWWKYCQIHVVENVYFECCQNEHILLTCAIIATVFLIVIVFLVAYLRYQISFLEILFKESAECLKAMPAIFLQPIFTFLILSGFYIFWIFVMSYLASSRYPESTTVRPYYNFDQLLTSNSTHTNVFENIEKKNVSVDSLKRFTVVEFNEGPWIQHMWWLCILGLIWVSEFVLACQQMITAGAVARWYFNGRAVSDKNPVWLSLRYLILYHMGSAAFGSLLITIFKVPRIIIGFLYGKYRQGLALNCCTKCGYSSCIYCFDCFENFAAFINHNAYTVVEMRGVNFLTAGKRAWIINVSNNLKIGQNNASANIVMFLNKAFVTATVGSIAFMFFNATESMYSPILPTLLVCVCSFFITHCVVAIFELTVDTLYLCLCEDQDINEQDGIWRQSPLIPDDIKVSFLQNKASTSASPDC